VKRAAVAGLLMNIWHGVKVKTRTDASCRQLINPSLQMALIELLMFDMISHWSSWLSH
jgi:hypothetical protein